MASLLLPVHCNANMEPECHEVDIGVGTQRYQYAWACGVCGAEIGVCVRCGVPEDGREHYDWCVGLTWN